MKSKIKIVMIVIACLWAFQMWGRYRIQTNNAGVIGVTYVYDRLTFRGYNLFGNYSLFPYPHDNFHAPNSAETTVSDRDTTHNLSRKEKLAKYTAVQSALKAKVLRKRLAADSLSNKLPRPIREPGRP